MVETTKSSRKRPAASRTSRRRPTAVVGVGGSAGSLAGFQQFFRVAPTDAGLAFVVVAHLDPEHKALLAELLQRTTSMPVREASQGARLSANVFVRDLVDARDVYLNAPARAHLRSVGGGTESFDSLLHPQDQLSTVAWRAGLATPAAGDAVTRRIRVRGLDGSYRGYVERQSVLSRAANGAPTRVLVVLDELPDSY